MPKNDNVITGFIDSQRMEFVCKKTNNVGGVYKILNTVQTVSLGWRVWLGKWGKENLTNGWKEGSFGEEWGTGTHSLRNNRQEGI